MPSPGQTFDSRTQSNGAPPLPLFRPEAVLYQQTKSYGDIILIRPLSLTLLTWLAVSVAASVFAFLLFGHYTEKVHLHGVVIAAGAAADGPGSRAELYVPERWRGAVHPGTKLLVHCPGCPPASAERAGLVQEISATPLPSSDIAAAGPAYKILVLLPPQAAPLSENQSPVGARVEAEIPLGRKPLLKWLFDRSGS